MIHPFISIENKNNVAELRIIGGISEWENSSEAFTRKVDEVLASGVTSIRAYINCYGGSMLEANEIGNQIQRFTGEKTCKIGAIAASAGGYLTTYFDKGKVTASSNTQFMMHDPSVFLHIQRLEDFDSNKKLYENLRNDVIDRFAKRTSLSTEEVATMMSATTWLNSQEAVEKGFIDSIDSETAELPEDTANLFKNYKNLPTDMVARLKNINHKPNPNNMNKLLLLMGLAPTATEDQAIEAYNALKQVGVEAITALAETKNLKKETIQKLANNNAATALEFVNEFELPTNTAPAGTEGAETPAGTPPTTPPATTPNDLVAVLENHLKGGGGKPAKTLNDYSPTELEELAEKEPAVYDALIKSTYNFK